jgi:hypothetical protein
VLWKEPMHRTEMPLRGARLDGSDCDRHDLLDRGFQFLRLEPERPRAALIGDPARRIDQVETIGPRGVRALGRIAELIEDSGNLDSQFAHAGAGNKTAFLLAMRTGEDDLVLYVARHLPDVARMRFRDVDHEEGNLASVLLVELVEGRNLPPEGRSGVASKDQHHRPLLGGEGGQLYLCGFVEPPQQEVGCGAAHLQRARPGAHPESFEWKNQERNGP